MTHSDTELREQLDLLISAFEHGYNTDLHNGVVKSLKTLITAKLTEARIDELNQIRPYLNKAGWAGTHFIYQTSYDIDKRIAALQSQETQL